MLQRDATDDSCKNGPYIDVTCKEMLLLDGYMYWCQLITYKGKDTGDATTV